MAAFSRKDEQFRQYALTASPLRVLLTVSVPLALYQALHQIFKVLDTLIERLMERYEQLRRGDEEQLRAEYHALLYRLNESHTYAFADGTLFERRILGVEPSGRLIVEQQGGETASYAFREIEFVLNN